MLVDSRAVCAGRDDDHAAAQSSSRQDRPEAEDMRIGMPRRTVWSRVADAAAQRLTRERRGLRWRQTGHLPLAGACVLAVFASACEKAARSPVQPSDPSAPVYVGVSCGEGARFIGEAFPCSAYARDSLGLTRLIGFLPDCLWASRDPSIVGLHPTFGGPVFVGIAGGSAEVTATYKALSDRPGWWWKRWTASRSPRGRVRQRELAPSLYCDRKCATRW